MDDFAIIFRFLDYFPFLGIFRIKTYTGNVLRNHILIYMSGHDVNKQLRKDWIGLLGRQKLFWHQWISDINSDVIV